MSTIKINSAKKEIVITKAFAKKAEEFKSEEYNLLKEAKADNPTFKVVVNKASKKDAHKGLTFKYMEQYLEKNGRTDLMDEFKLLTNNEDGNQSEAYGTVREWFLTNCSEVDEIVKKNNKAREEILKRVKEKKAEMAKAA